jgi:hypothetical protein
MTSLGNTEIREAQLEEYLFNRSLLKLWLDINDSSTITKDGSNNMSAWNDKSGNNNNAVQVTPVNQPIYSNNNRGEVLFNGTTSKMVATFPATFSQPTTIFCVGKAATGKAQYFYDGLVGGSSRQALSSDNTRWFIYAGGVSVLPNSALYNSNLHLHTAVFNGVTSKYRIDKGNQVTGDVGTHPVDGLRIGVGSSGVSFFLDGSINEILLFAGLLTDAQIKAVESYLSDKWGV